MRVALFIAASMLLTGPVSFGAEPDSNPFTIDLRAESGVPLRLYLSHRLTKRLGDPVHAKLLEPVYSFNREILPAGLEVSGTVTKLKPVSKYRRISAMLAGDFTPLCQAEVEFTSIALSDGRRIPIHTVESPGLNSIFSLPKPNAKPKKVSQPNKPPQNSRVAAAEQQAKDQVRTQIEGQINARTRGIASIVRGPDKKERLEEFLLAKLPYHPQWVRKGTRFDAELRDTVPFGQATVTAVDLLQLGSQPAADSVVHARLVTEVSSGTAKQGEKIVAIVTQPLFSGDNKLVLPEGTRLTGAVTQVRRARSFHRGGQLRFAFEKVEMPDGNPQLLAAAPPALQSAAILDSAEPSGTAQVKVDKEGGAKAVESKTRLIAPALALLVAAKAADNDAGRQGTNDANVGGRTLGGGMGFGLLGSLAAQSSKSLGMAFGYYGLAWSVYNTVVATGGEVEFDRDAAMDIRFGARAPEGEKFQAANSPGLGGNGSAKTGQ